MDRSVYIALALILIIYLVAGFFYFQGGPKTETGPEQTNTQTIKPPNFPKVYTNSSVNEYFVPHSPVPDIMKFKIINYSFPAGKLNKSFIATSNLTELISWNTVTPGYFLAKNLFNGTTILKEAKLNSLGVKKAAVRRWYDEQNQSVIKISVIEAQNKTVVSKVLGQVFDGLTTSSNVRFYLGNFALNNQTIKEYRFASVKHIENDTRLVSKFVALWSKDRFVFIIESVPEYKDEIKGIAKNIIKRYLI